MNKRGYIVSYADWFKGFLIGIIIGGVIAYLFLKGKISWPVAKETAKATLVLIR